MTVGDACKKKSDKSSHSWNSYLHKDRNRGLSTTKEAMQVWDEALDPLVTKACQGDSAGQTAQNVAPENATALPGKH